MRSYISRVEGGYTAPSLSTLEKFAEALSVETYQLLFRGDGKPAAVKTQEQDALSKPAKKLVKLFNDMSSPDRKLLLTIASKIAKS